MPFSHPILCRPLLLPPSIFPSIRVFPMSQMAKVLEFYLQHQSFQEIFSTDFFRIDWLYLFAVQGTLKSLLQHHSSKTSILRCAAFFIVQFSHPYMTIGKIIAFLPRSKCLLISWLQSPCLVILEPKNIKSLTVSIVSPSICHEVMGPDAVIFVF